MADISLYCFFQRLFEAKEQDFKEYEHLDQLFTWHRLSRSELKTLPSGLALDIKIKENIVKTVKLVHKLGSPLLIADDNHAITLDYSNLEFRVHLS